MDKMEEYKKYMKKCEMTGNKMFKLGIEDKNVQVIKYIESSEPERLVRIPKFVDKIRISAFSDVRQRIKVQGEGLKDISFDGYLGDRIDVSMLDTKQVINTEFMFYRCVRLKELDLSSFDTSKVINMDSMFSECVNIEKLDLSNFDTSMAVTMGFMFLGCKSLKELNISNFNTSKVFEMKGMFSECNNLKLIITNNDTAEWLRKHSEEISIPEGVRIIVK